MRGLNGGKWKGDGQEYLAGRSVGAASRAYSMDCPYCGDRGKLMSAKDRRFEHLDTALDEVSYEWLATEHPGLVDAIQTELAAGISPREIRLRVQDRTNRRELALRCEQAARFLDSAG